MQFFLLSKNPLDLRVDGTPAALVALGRVMMNFRENTFLTGQLAAVTMDMTPLQGLKLLISETMPEAPITRVRNNIMEIEMDKESFAILGGSLAFDFDKAPKESEKGQRLVFPMAALDGGKVSFTAVM